MRVLCVCSGNICRSPMAEGLLRSQAARRGAAVVVASAGTLGIVGRAPHQHAVAACARVDVDISAQRSQGLDADLLAWATHVVCMEQEHLDFVRAHMPGRQAAALLLDGRGIADPLGQDLAAFEATRDLIARACAALLDGQVRR